jgi:predicted O-methyltransferase YrrM
MNDNLDKIKSVIRRLDRDGDSQIVSRNPGAAEFRYVSIPSGEAEAIRTWVVRENATNAIEIGLAYGYSALHICEGLLINNGFDSRHTIIDPWQVQDEGYAKAGLDILSEAGLDSIIEFHSDMSQIVLPQFFKASRTFDFAFVDGNHRCDYVFVDLFYLGLIVEPGCVIFLDDYNYPGIKKAATFFVKNLDWNIEEVNCDRDHVWAVIRTREEPDKRDFRHFVEF